MSSKSFEIFAQILKYIIKYFKWVVIAAAVIIALSGIYRVESNEVAVVLRFGRLVTNISDEQIKKPGLHFCLPFFIDEVIKVPVQTVHEKEIITHYKSAGRMYGDIEENGYLLTGDNNVVLIKATVKYKISGAARYALYSCDADSAIEGIVSGELTRLVTHMDIDSVLTSGKAGLSFEITKNSQTILDELKTGIEITNIELTNIVPPAETKEYFESVVNASVNKETAIQEAKEYASTLKLDAEAKANGCKQNAIYNQTIKLTKARREMAEFNGLYGQYVKDPQIITVGRFRQRVSAVLAQSGGFAVVPENGEPPIIVLP